MSCLTLDSHLGGAHGAGEVFARNDVRGGLGPGLWDFDVLLLEDDLAGIGLMSASRNSIDTIEAVLAHLSEFAFDYEAFSAQRDNVAAGGFVLLTLSSGLSGLRHF